MPNAELKAGEDLHRLRVMQDAAKAAAKAEEDEQKLDELFKK